MIAAATHGPSALWYATRGAGAVALVLLTISVALGVGEVRMWRPPGAPRFAVAAVHRTASLLAVVFVAIHVITVVADPFPHIGLLTGVVPFVTSYRPLWLGLGTIGFDLMLAVTSGGDFFSVKGAIEALWAELRLRDELEVVAAGFDLLAAGRSCELWLRGARVGVLGEVSAEGRKLFALRGPTTVAELRLAPLIELAELTPRFAELPATPATSRDINLELSDGVRWSLVAAAAREAAGETLEKLEFRDVYRNDALSAKGEKRLLFSVVLRDRQATLSSPQADAIRDRIVAACSQRFGARLA